MGRWPWLISTFLLLVLSACQPSADTALGTAQRFLDEHYVRIDLQKAKTYTTGLASHKLAEEERLIEGQVIDESTRKPHVHYKLLETHAGDGGAVTFLFEGTIRVDDAGSFNRQWLVTAKKEGGQWRVSNYQEYEQAAAGS